MKKHVKYILIFIAVIFGLVATGIALLTLQFFNFYNSYITEEKHEIEHQIKLTELAIAPIVSNKEKLSANMKELNSDDIAIVIQDENNNIIATTKPDIKIKDIKSENLSNKTFKNYKNSLKNKMLIEQKTIKSKGKNYTLTVVLIEDDMIKTFIENQSSILLISILGLIGIILFSLYVIFKIKIPFDKLQHSALEITKGDLNSEIQLIPDGILSQHSQTIFNMANQLKNKIKDLEYIENCKTEMLQGFSHEVKTPLTSIMLACDLLKEENECQKIIKSNCERLNNLMMDIIDIANLEQETIDKLTQFNPLNLQDCINSALNNVKLAISNIKTDIKAENALVNGDFNMLETAITNILTNAIRYSKTDKIDITLLNKDNQAYLSIKDYGVGIDKQHKDKIFDKFYRVDKTRSRELGGNGLGLAIVKQIVELHKGKIELITKENEGCNFIITLPIETNITNI